MKVYTDFDIIDKLFLGDKTLFDAARQSFVSWKPIRDEVIELMRAGKRNEAARITKGKGKFDVPPDIEAAGELGSLAISVREMTENLSKVIASRDALNKEVIERKVTEKARQKLMDDLETKAAEIERFVYTVSHDLKSPLLTIQGFLGLLEKDALGGETKRLHGDVAQIQKAAGQMQNLLADLLEISRIGRLVNPPEEIKCLKQGVTLCMERKS